MHACRKHRFVPVPVLLFLSGCLPAKEDILETTGAVLFALYLVTVLFLLFFERLSRGRAYRRLRGVLRPVLRWAALPWCAGAAWALWRALTLGYGPLAVFLALSLILAGIFLFLWAGRPHRRADTEARLLSLSLLAALLFALLLWRGPVWLDALLPY